MREGKVTKAKSKSSVFFASFLISTQAQKICLVTVILFLDVRLVYSLSSSCSSAGQSAHSLTQLGTGVWLGLGQGELAVFVAKSSRSSVSNFLLQTWKIFSDENFIYQSSFFGSVEP